MSATCKDEIAPKPLLANDTSIRLIIAQIPEDKLTNQLSVNVAKAVQWHIVTFTTKLGVQTIIRH